MFYPMNRCVEITSEKQSFPRKAALTQLGKKMESALAQESVTVCMKMPLNQKSKGFMKKGHIIKTQESEYRTFHCPN